MEATSIVTAPEASALRKLCVVDYHLHGPSPRDLDELACHLHGWLYRLQGMDPDVRIATDPEQRTAPFGAWVLPRPKHALSVRVCWYGQDEAVRATRAIALRDAWEIGGHPYVVMGVDPRTREPITSASLLDRGEDARFVRLDLLSPLLLVRRGRPHCSIDGGAVMASIISRWLQLWPGSLPGDLADEGRAWMARICVTACDLRSELVERGKVRGVGLRGWAEWDLGGLEHPARRRLVLSLLRCGETVGLGASCAYGLGAIKITVRTTERRRSEA